MLSGFFSNRIESARDLQHKIDDRGRRWIRRIGPGFIAGLFGFSLIAWGFLGVVYFEMFDRGVVYLINGGKYEALPVYFNPLLHLIIGFLIVLILLLGKRAELTKK